MLPSCVPAWASGALICNVHVAEKWSFFQDPGKQVRSMYHCRYMLERSPCMKGRSGCQISAQFSKGCNHVDLPLCTTTFSKPLGHALCFDSGSAFKSLPHCSFRALPAHGSIMDLRTHWPACIHEVQMYPQRFACWALLKVESCQRACEDVLTPGRGHCIPAAFCSM